MLRADDLATAKQRILQHERRTNRRHVRLRRHFNHLVALAGGAGECSDADYASLEGSVREIKNWLVDNDGERPPDKYDACTVTGMTRLPSTSCMVSCTIECHGQAQKIFAKRLTDRQMKYYQDHMEWIAPIHAPFRMYTSGCQDPWELIDVAATNANNAIVELPTDASEQDIVQYYVHLLDKQERAPKMFDIAVKKYDADMHGTFTGDKKRIADGIVSFVETDETMLALTKRLNNAESRHMREEMFLLCIDKRSLAVLASYQLDVPVQEDSCLLGDTPALTYDVPAHFVREKMPMYNPDLKSVPDDVYFVTLHTHPRFCGDTSYDDMPMRSLPSAPDVVTHLNAGVLQQLQYHGEECMVMDAIVSHRDVVVFSAHREAVQELRELQACWTHADILAMHEYGVPATTLPPNLQEEAEAWAIEQVRALHDHGLYHGDLFKSPRKIHLGNVLVKVDGEAIQEVRLIDFGPPHESQSDDDLLRVERDLLRRYDLMKSGDAETIDAKDLAAPPTPMKKKKQPHRFTTKKRRRLSSMMPLEEDDFDVDDIL